MHKLILNNKELDGIFLKEVQFLPPYVRSTYVKKSGVEHFRLLHFLSHSFHKNSLIDIGTNVGTSAAALASNQSNFVLSFDIYNRTQKYIECCLQEWHGCIICMHRNQREGKEFSGVNDLYNFSNIDFFVTANFSKYINLFLGCPIIFLDIDHSGTIERAFIKELIEKKYKGLLILDDIHCFEAMEKLWNGLERLDNYYGQKYDITKYGHHGGTGVINFSDDIEIILD